MKNARQQAPLQSLVSCYISKFRPIRKAELGFFKSQPSFRLAVEAAALARNKEGKKFRHQWRLSNNAIASGEKLLIRKENLRQIKLRKSFDDLLKAVEGIVRNKKIGLGELYSYDTALRIGAWLRLMPRKVYMHSGAREGAKILQLPVKSSSLDLKFFDPALRKLKPHEIENFLCIFRNEFRKFAN